MSCQNFASTSEGTLAYGVQTACGTPATDLTALRFTSETLNQTATSIQSDEITPNRNVYDLVRTAISVAGQVNIDFSYEMYDDFLQGLLQSATALDGVLGTPITNGTTKHYYTIEKDTPTADGTHYYSQFTDMQVASFTLNTTQGQVVNGDFGFMGSEAMVNSSTSLDATLPYDPSPAFPVFNSLSNVSQILIDGATAGYVEGINITVTNNLREQRAIGYVAPAGVASGQFVVTGSINLYFADNALYTKFLNDQAFTLTFTLDDKTGVVTGNSYTFNFPNCKFENMTKNITGNNQDVLLSGTFQALYNTGIGGTISISKHDATDV